MTFRILRFYDMVQCSLRAASRVGVWCFVFGLALVSCCSREEKRGETSRSFAGFALACRFRPNKRTCKQARYNVAL